MKQNYADSSTYRSSVATGVSTASRENVDADIEQMVRTLTFLRAEDLGFVPGRELDHWVAAQLDWLPGANR